MERYPLSRGDGGVLSREGMDGNLLEGDEGVLSEWIERCLSGERKGFIKMEREGFYQGGRRRAYQVYGERLIMGKSIFLTERIGNTS